MLREIIGTFLLLAGIMFMMVAAIGIVRMPDLFLRMSAVSKAASLGVACLLLAVALSFDDLGVSARVVAAVVFVMLTAPVASHMIGRAGYITGVPLWKGTVRDDLRHCYDLEKRILRSHAGPPAAPPNGDGEGPVAGESLTHPDET